jgi:hypothetical protein
VTITQVQEIPMKIATPRWTTRLVRHSAVLVPLVMLAACNSADVSKSTDQSEAMAPITERAVAAIALKYLPQNTSYRGALDDETGEQGLVGTDLRYNRAEDQASALVEVGVLPLAAADKYLAEIADCAKDPQCVELDENVYLHWLTAEPGEDPGGVYVTRVSETDLQYAMTAGTSITSDPRQLALGPSVETLQKIVQDPLLRLLTTRGAIEAGEGLARWQGHDSDRTVPDAKRQVIGLAQDMPWR